MKKHLIKTLAVIVVLSATIGLVACGGATPPPAPPQVAPPGDGAAPAADLPSYNFIWGTPFGGTHHILLGIIEPLIEEIYEKSNGRIVINVIAGGGLVTAASAVDDVIMGSVDFAWTMPGSTPGRFLLSEMLEFSGHFGSGVEATNTFWDVFEVNQYLQAEHGDYKLLAFFTTEPGEIYNSVRPVRTPEDTAGLLIRTPSPMVERTLQAYGASSVNMPSGDVYDAADRGIVDGTGTPHSGVVSFSFYEVFQYATDGLNLYVSPHMFVMSWDAWNRLHPYDQALLEEITERSRGLSLRAAAQYDRFSAEGLVYLETIDSLTIHRLTDEERLAFYTAAIPVVDAHIANVEAQGLPARDVYNAFIAARNAQR